MSHVEPGDAQKDLREQMRCAIQLQKSCASEASHATAESVLRETNEFLRELLEEKRHWYEVALKEAEASEQKWFDEAERRQKDRERLRIALAQAVQEVLQHNADSEASFETHMDLIAQWSELLKVN